MQRFENNPNWNKSKRMQLKAIICVAGIFLLFIFALVLLLTGTGKKEEHIPVVEELRNIYITETADTYISIFDGENKTFPRGENIAGADAVTAGQLADITVTDGIISNIRVKASEKINGKVVGVEPGVGVEVENLGFLSFDEHVSFYMLYGELRLGSAQDIRIGYDFADFVMENGKICGVLLVRDETMEYIRVQIKNSDYAGAYHDMVTLSCDTDYTVRYMADGSLTEEVHPAGESITVSKDSPWFSGGEERIYIVPSALTGRITLSSVNRSQGVPVYRGRMEIRLMEEGFAVINEVLLEEYLYAVVPSEMPAGYPLEALKAQAICARTYAYSHMLSPGLADVGAHVDDSTSYQVYNNIMEQNSTTVAVKETAGQLLYGNGEPVSTYYYSTSCGFGSDEHVWKSESAPELPYLTASSVSLEGVEGKESIYTAESMREEAMFAQFLDYPPESDFEKNEAWYRWTYTVQDVNEEQMLKVLQNRYAANAKLILTLKGDSYVSEPVEELGTVKSIKVLSRNTGGVADELLIEGEEASYKVISELNIRYVLCDGKTQVLRQDGSTVDMKSLLPSAFFVISPVQNDENMIGYELYGGGFGHGAGMSQNGAKNMAEAGYTAQQILEFFYKDSSVTPLPAGSGTVEGE